MTRASLVLLLASGVAHADTMIEAPAKAVLGRDATIEVTVVDLPAGASVLVTPGHLEGTTWSLPVERFPQVGLVVVAAADGTIVASRAVPLWGQATLRVETVAQASVVVEIEGTYAGPVIADAKGVATVPLVVPPGATEGMTLATTTGGGVKRREVPLGVPPLQRTWTVCTRGETATRFTWLGTRLERSAAPFGAADGQRAPAVAHPAATASTCDLTQPAPVEEAAAPTAAPVVARQTTPLAWRARPTDVPARVLLSVRAGLTTNLGRVTAPAVVATAGVRLPVLADQIVADVAFGAYSTSLAAPAMDDTATGRLSTLRVLARLAYRVDLGRWAAWGGTALGFAFTRSTLGSEVLGMYAERAASPAGGVFGGIGRDVSIGQVVVEAAYIHARLADGPLAGQIGGLQVTAGYSVGL